jgi:mannose-6-phosphate isomerase-like protein (cupin superfamily)
MALTKAETAESPTIVQLTDLPGVACPCGIARRAFANQETFPGTLHLTEIHVDARVHYHRQHTEVYVIVEAEADAAIELDGIVTPVRPWTSILIPPGVRHRAVGKMKVIIVCTPAFDPADEYFD